MALTALQELEGPVQTAAAWPLRQSPVELAGIAGLVAFYFAAESLFGSDASSIVNTVGPAWLSAFLALGIWKMLRADRQTIWTCLFFFRLATVILFGIGSLVPLFVNETSRAYAEAFFVFYDRDIAKLNLIIALCVLTVLIGVYVVDILFPPSWLQRPTSGRTRVGHGARGFGLAFLGAGLAIKYFVIFPAQMGWTEGVLSGIVGALGGISLPGIYLLTVWSLTYSTPAFAWLCALIAAEMLTGALLLSKEAAMLPLLMLLVGLLTHKITYRRILFAVAAGSFVFIFMQPFVSYGRNQLLRLSGGSGVASLSDRIDIATSYFEPAIGSAEASELQAAWLRISYVNQATYAINAYDRGIPGNSLEHFAASFVPRFVWPDKPIIHPGLEFTRIASGRDIASSTTPGMFAESYWNFGWLGIPLLMIPYAIILTVLSRFALGVMHRENWLYMPIVFLSFRAGLTDGHYILNVVGGTVIIAGMFVATVVVDRALAAFRSGRWDPAL